MMEDIIKLKSRGGQKNYLKKMKKSNGEDSKTFLLKTEIPSIRAGYVEDNLKFVHPAGGPFIMEGELLEEVGKKVKSINHEYKLGTLITFE